MQTTLFYIIYAISPILAINFALSVSNVPEELWYDYKVVMICESNLDQSTIGDGGVARGLLQIHVEPWTTWSNDHGYDYDVNDPIDNINMAYLIQEKYDLVRNRDRWNQWSMKPTFSACRQRLRELK